MDWTLQNTSGSNAMNCFVRNLVRINILLFILMHASFLKHAPPEVFYKKGALKSFTKFTEKHLCQSLFFTDQQLYQKEDSGTGVFL